MIKRCNGSCCSSLLWFSLTGLLAWWFRFIPNSSKGVEPEIIENESEYSKPPRVARRKARPHVTCVNCLFLAILGEWENDNFPTAGGGSRQPANLCRDRPWPVTSPDSVMASVTVKPPRSTASAYKMQTNG